MPASIQDIVFPYPLKWVDKGAPRVLGSDTVTRSGNVVMLRGENTSQAYLPAKLLFEWTSFSAVQTLYSYWQAGGEYIADLEDTGEIVSIRFAAKDGIVNVKHQIGKDVVHAYWQGTPNDLYSGELNVIIVT